jgi:3-hydroxybutyryl-CoA dehydrogenase
MGSGIAAVSVLAGNKTVLSDSIPEKAAQGRENALAHCQELLNNGLASPDAVTRAAELLSVAEPERALPDARWVIEAIVENLAAKQELFAKLDRLLPSGVTLLSNTSGLRITDISAKMTRHRERAVTAHFWFPAHLVPLVEVVMGDETAEAVAVSVKEELTRWGKAAVLVRKDLPGQLANRILQAIIREAVNIVDMGLASPDDVDLAVKMGMGIRFPAWGPLEHIDAVGLDLCTSVQDTVLPGLSVRTDAAPLMRDLAENGSLGYKTGRGIYDWSTKDMKTLERQRNEFIIHALKKIRNYSVRG